MDRQETIVVGRFRDDQLTGTNKFTVRVIEGGLPVHRLHWFTWQGQDKDQSPIGSGLVFYRESSQFPGIFVKEEILDPWDWTDEEDVIAVMGLVRGRVIAGFPFEKLGGLVKHILKAKGIAADEL